MTNTGSNQPTSSLLGGIKLNLGAASFNLNPNSASFVPSGTTTTQFTPAQTTATQQTSEVQYPGAGANTSASFQSVNYNQDFSQQQYAYSGGDQTGLMMNQQMGTGVQMDPASGSWANPAVAGIYPGTEQVTPEIQYLRDFYEYAMNNTEYFMNLIQFHDIQKIGLATFLGTYGNSTEGYGAYYKWLYEKEEQEQLYSLYLSQMEDDDQFWGEDGTLVKGGKKKPKKAKGDGETGASYMKDLEIYNRNQKKNKKKNTDNKPQIVTTKAKPSKPPPPKPSNIVVLHEDKNLVEVDETRDPVSIVFIGHVDVGKSTICGNIMYTTGKVDSREIHKYEEDAKEKGRDSWWLAYCMDVNQEERQRGKTVEVGRATFVTKKKRWTIFDAPGHKNYVPNMIMGASNADVAALVVSARINEFEAGFEKGGQTQEHAMLARSLGVSKLVVIINKMDDESVDWSEKRFLEIKESLIPYLTKEIGYSLESIHWVPISGLKGQNINKKLDLDVCPWYDGPTLFQLLDELPLPNRDQEGPVRIPILDKMKDRGYMAFGKVESGAVKMGDTLYLMPEWTPTKIVNIYNSDDQCVRYAKVGQNVKVRLAGINKEEDIHKGQVISSIKNPVPTAEVIECEVSLLDLPNDIISEGYSCMLHLHTYAEECTIVKLLGTYFPKEDGGVEIRKKKVAASGQTIKCRIEGRIPMALEKHDVIERLGTFILRDQGKTIGIGKVLKYKPLRDMGETKKEVKAEESKLGENLKEEIKTSDTGDQTGGGTPAQTAASTKLKGDDGVSADVKVQGELKE